MRWKGRWDGWGDGGVVVGKCRQLYLNNNKIIFKKEVQGLNTKLGSSAYSTRARKEPS